MTTFDALVVGAGLSGLSAARRLKSLRPELAVGVLEARDRVGGRTLSARTAEGAVLDLGAGWVGDSHVELLRLIEEFQLTLVEQYYPPSSNDHRLTECVGYPLSPLSAEEARQVDGYVALIASLSRELDPAVPWKHSRAEEWDTMSVAQHVRAQNLLPAAEQEVLLFAQTVLAGVPEHMSFLYFLLDVTSGGGMEAQSDGEQGAQRWKVREGTQQISVLLASKAREMGVTLLLNHAVEKIETIEHTSFVSCTNGARIASRKIVFAISPLLIADIDFRPHLPFEKQEFCKYMGVVRAAKIFLVYETAFWLDPKPFKDSQSTHFTELGFMHNIFHGSVSGENGKCLPTLTGVITGQAAIDFEKLSDAEQKDAILRQIERMYGVITKPLHYHCYLWGKDAFSKGCYAGIGTPTGGLFKYGEFMRKPIGDFYFASTETAVEFYGYMEGAIRAGYRAAAELVSDVQDAV